MKDCGGPTAPRYRLRAFDVLECERCRMLYRDPFPDAEELREMYEDPAYVESSYFTGSNSKNLPDERPEIPIYREGLQDLARQR